MSGLHAKGRIETTSRLMRHDGIKSRGDWFKHARWRMSFRAMQDDDYLPQGWAGGSAKPGIPSVYESSMQVAEAQGHAARLKGT